MNSALILHGTTVMVVGVLIFFVRARQARRELDERMAAENVFPVGFAHSTAGEHNRTTKELVAMKDLGLDKVLDTTDGCGGRADTHG